MKKAGNISSILLMLVVAAVLAWLKWPASPTDQPQTQQAVPESPSSRSPEDIRDQLHQAQMAAITLPPPPAPAPAPAVPSPNPAGAEAIAKPVQKIKRLTRTMPDQPTRTVRPIKRAENQPRETESPKVKPIKPRRHTRIAEAKPEVISPLSKAKSEDPQSVPVLRTLKPRKPEPVVEPEEEAVEPAPAEPDRPVRTRPEPIKNAREQAAELARQMPDKSEAEENWRERADQVVTVSASHSKAEVQTGRTLLRLLEHGSGPLIEIAWPARQQDRLALYESFDRCFGMVTAVMDRSGMLYRDGGRPGQPWQVSMDAYSGFVRQPTGATIQDEEIRANSIRRRHNLARQTNMVRVFPRSVDAVILGGLSRLIGRSYKEAGVIRARYRRVAGGLEIHSISMDGNSLPGRISVRAERQCGGLT